MKPISRLFLIYLSILVLTKLTCGQYSNTDKYKVNYNFVVEYNSRYLWRGYAFSESSVIQPSASITYRKFNLNIWSNFDLNKIEGSPVFNEYDIILSYNYESKNLGIQPLVQFYIYPGTDEPVTGELIVNASYYFRNLMLFTSQYIDIINYKGAYYGNAGAGYGNKIYQNLFFDISASFGWANSKFNETYGGISKNALNHYACNAELTYYPAEIFYTKFRFELSKLLDKDLKEIQTPHPIINWGLSIGLEL